MVIHTYVFVSFVSSCHGESPPELNRRPSQVSSKDVASIIGWKHDLLVGVPKFNKWIAGRADSPFALHARPTPPPPPPEWMDPDVHDIRRQQPRVPSPSDAAEVTVASDAAQSNNVGDSTSSGSVAASLHEVRRLLCREPMSEVAYLQARHRESKQTAAVSSSVKAGCSAAEGSAAVESSEARRMSVSQALQVALFLWIVMVVAMVMAMVLICWVAIVLLPLFVRCARLMPPCHRACLAAACCNLKTQNVGGTVLI